MDRLNVKPADIYPRVTSEIPFIVAMIDGLVKAGHAYPAENGDVYFDVSAFPGYGKLSKRPADEQVSQEPPSGYKRSPADFALWKAAKPGEPWWASPWGRGRPGWHIECSAMAQRHLGEQIDIHGGGLDLVFPHHENEIAQSEASCACEPFAKYWMHNGMLQIGDEKMSKSLGNIVPIAAFLKEHEPEALRLLVLSSHYRGVNTLSDESIAAAEGGLERLRGALRPARGSAGAAQLEEVEAVERAAATAVDVFTAAMDDDFGTPGALAALFSLVTAINTARDAGVFGEPFEDAQEVLVDLSGVLGFDLRSGYGATLGRGMEAEPFIELLVEMREAARYRKDWSEADRIRDRLAELGVALEDAPDGTTWRVAREA
jgi:cysteinyl-tRNA synthetase